jgi:hypothetical protein
VVAAPRAADEDEGPELTSKGSGANLAVLIAGVVAGLALVGALAWIILK